MRALVSFLVLLAITAPAAAMIATAPIREVIHRAGPRFAACTERCLQCPPGDHHIAVAFTIEPTGIVSAAEITTSDHPDPSVEQCFLGVVRTLVFPSYAPRRGSVRVSYPFVLIAP